MFFIVFHSDYEVLENYNEKLLIENLHEKLLYTTSLPMNSRQDLGQREFPIYQFSRSNPLGFFGKKISLVNGVEFFATHKSAEFILPDSL